jgi:hypothetical protein
MLSGKYNLNPLDARSILVFPGQAHHCDWFSIFEIILKAEFPPSLSLPKFSVDSYRFSTSWTAASKSCKLKGLSIKPLAPTSSLSRL